MAKITEIVRDSRNGNCPAVHAIDGDIRTAQGETIPEGMVLVQLYGLAEDYAGAADDPHNQVDLAAGEFIGVAPESLILRAADEIRARRGELV